MAGSGDPAQGPIAATPSETQSQKLLLVTITVLILIAVAVYAIYGGAGAGGGAGSDYADDPCASAKMPAQAPGITCGRGAAGRYAVLTSTTPGATGVAPPTGAVASKTYAATAASCVDESACQGYCSGDPACIMYTYNMGAVPSKACTAAADCGDPDAYTCQAWCRGGPDDKCLAGKCSKTGGPCAGTCTLNACPMAGSVCTTYTGTLPATVAASRATPYTTAGIPATLLPLAA